MKTPEYLGPYTLLAPLGDGKRSRVWLASVGDGPDNVVLKLAGKEQPELRARLLQEAELAGSLDHPNIVRVLECGQSEGVTWLASRHVAGAQLPLTLANFRQLLLALVHVHAQGIVHAGISPDSLLLDEHGDLRLAGFGRARRIQAGSAAEGGAALFMAPEQLRGERLDVRADLYSCGAVLYQILTGKEPFDGSGAQAPLPSAMAQSLGVGFDALMAKVLARDRNDRHASAFALLSDFDGACNTGVRRPAGVKMSYETRR